MDDIIKERDSAERAKEIHYSAFQVFRVCQKRVGNEAIGKELNVITTCLGVVKF